MRQILCFGDSNTWGYNPKTGNRFEWGTRWTSREVIQRGADMLGWTLEDLISADSVERILQDVPTIRTHSIRNQYGNAEQHPIKESRIVLTVNPLMKPLLRMLLWRSLDFLQKTLMMS